MLSKHHNIKMCGRVQVQLQTCLTSFRIVWPCIVIDSLWIKPTDALSSNFIIGIITTSVQIAQNNNFLRKIILNLNQKIKYNRSNQDKKNIWTTFTYYTPKIRKITNLFKQTNVGIAFKTTNTTQQLMKQKPATHKKQTKVEYTSLRVILTKWRI